MPDFQSSLVPFSNQEPLPVTIQCSGKMIKDHGIDLCFEITGDVSQIDFESTKSSPQRMDNLWQKTCFEVFIKSDNSASYWEYNMSPSKDWAIYGFTDYREGKFDELSIEDLPIQTMQQETLFTLQCFIVFPRALLNEKLNENLHKKLKIGLSTVIQNSNGDIYYYALHHSKMEADFHDERSFTIEVSNS